MARWLKHSTAVDIKVGPFVDSTDGNTEETGLTITQPDILLSKNGGTFAQKSAAQTLSHDAHGFYTCNLSTTDTGTLGTLVVSIHESGGLSVWHDFMVVPANVWDSFFGADLLDVSVTQIAGTTVSTSSAQLGVNVVNAAGTAWGSGAITAAALAADAVDEIWDEVMEGSYSARQFLRLLGAALGGEASGLSTTTAVYRDASDTKTRISATVDADGNRSAVTLDLT
jgi:hypothetical protein